MGGKRGRERETIYNNKETEKREDRRAIIRNHQLIEATEPEREEEKEEEKEKKDSKYKGTLLMLLWQFLHLFGYRLYDTSFLALEHAAGLLCGAQRRGRRQLWGNRRI